MKEDRRGDSLSEQAHGASSGQKLHSEFTIVRLTNKCYTRGPDQQGRGAAREEGSPRALAAHLFTSIQSGN
eukprot:7733624-Pyramimonas_sp.AAC.1